MSTMRDGNNSPERRVKTAQSHTNFGQRNQDFNGTIRGHPVAAPKAPPPKMKDLFMPPTPTPIGDKENALDIERSASVVRHMEPEDPYDDSKRYAHHAYAQQQQTFHSSTNMGPPPSRPAYPRSDASYTTNTTSSSRPLSRQDYPVAPPSRQASNTSSVMSAGASSAVSGSENWETYTDTSENDEADATDAYYAKVKAQQMRQYQQQQGFKRPAQQQFGASTTKRMREHQQAHFEPVAEGSEAGWTDDGDVGDTY